MNHSFDIAHAKAYGLPEAILINNFQFWIAKNRANARHQHEGRTWTYNSAKALAELLPYLSDRQIRRALDSLAEQGVLLKGNFNTSTYDRTLWFAFSDECIFQIRPHHSPDSANGKTDSGDSETDVNTASKPAVNKENKRASQSVLPGSFTPDDTARDIATSLGLNAGDELTAFADHHAAKGSTFLCWQAAFRTWLRNAAKFSRKPAATTASRRVSAPENFSAAYYGSGGKL